MASLKQIATRHTCTPNPSGAFFSRDRAISDSDFEAFFELLKLALSCIQKSTGKPSSPKAFNLNEIRTKMGAFSESRKTPAPNFLNLPSLGEGAFGSVFAKDMKTAGKYIRVDHISSARTMVAELHAHHTMLLHCGDPEKHRILGLLSFEFHPEIPAATFYFPKKHLDLAMGLENCRDSGLPREIGLTYSVISDLLRALSFLERIKLVHGDLKGSNVLIDWSPEGVFFVLGDFGAMRLESYASYYSPNEYRGTITYKPPEKIESADMEVTHSCMTWQLGLVALETLTLKGTFHEKDIQSIPTFAKEKPFIGDVEKTEVVDDPSETKKPHLKDFLVDCLNENPKRLTPAQLSDKYPDIPSKASISESLRNALTRKPETV